MPLALTLSFGEDIGPAFLHTGDSHGITHSRKMRSCPGPVGQSVGFLCCVSRVRMEVGGEAWDSRPLDSFHLVPQHSALDKFR